MLTVPQEIENDGSTDLLWGSGGDADGSRVGRCRPRPGGAPSVMGTITRRR